MVEARPSGSGGTLDLEKELTCAICTDLLYQPLTLLDCLHTFCGSCLKEWFSWQAVSAATRRPRNPHPYTCPSCRASVRDTRPNASVTTLLDMFLGAHPGKGKTEVDKEESRKNYTPGDHVLPEVTFRGSDEEGANDDEDDQRLLQEVRELSMATVDPGTARGISARPERVSRGPRTAARTPGEVRRAQRSTRPVSQQAQLSESRLRQHDASGGDRHVDHQPSLRSLLSASEADSNEVQQEIMHSIMADGWFDQIDIDNLTQEQEDELTTRIANAYRLRQRQREQSRHGRRDESSIQPPTSIAPNAPSNHERSASSSNQSALLRPRPPISRPHLFEQAAQDPGRLRSASASSRRSTRSTHSQTGAAGPAARSSTDLSERPQTEQAARDRRRRLSSSTTRSSTDPENTRTLAHAMRDAPSSNLQRPSSSESSRRSTERRRDVDSVDHSSPQITSGPANEPRDLQPPSTSASTPTQTDELANRGVRASESMAALAPELAQSAPVEPQINCSKCKRPNIQYELHYHCNTCLDGTLNLCQPCYRSGQGCLHWFGFGYLAYSKWERVAAEQAWPSNFEPPHVLQPRRYLRRPDTIAPYPEYPGTVNAAAAFSNPETRLQQGAFCERCFEHSEDCYWHCSVCLDGAWGFCDACVRRGLHCTHPLTALAHKQTKPDLPRDSNASFTPLPHLPQRTYVLLPVSMDCDLCHGPIPSSRPRYHCYQCSNGDYDVCEDCYHFLESTGKIAATDGSQGWRRCLHRHRMAVLGTKELRPSIQQRVTLSGLVGGWALKEDGSVRAASAACVAKWSFWPKEGSSNELAFPKGAELRQVEVYNPDWYWGVYAGSEGFFPGPYVRVI